VAYGESGYRLALGRAVVTPYANLQYAQIRRMLIGRELFHGKA
jgi:uncharacterized protein with beta-barrel porin domain